MKPTRILCALLSMSSTLAAFAQETISVSGTKFWIDSETNTAVVIGPENRSATSVAIPYQINTQSKGYVPVVAIADEAFKDCTNLQQIDFDVNHMDSYSGFKRIGERAFMNCTSLREFVDYLPDQIEEFCAGAFRGCSALESITFPESLAIVGDSAFARCSSLEVAYTNAELTQIGYLAFAGCNAMTSFYHNGSKLHDIGMYAFNKCTSMTTAYFPEASVITITSTFDGCEHLSSVTLPKTLTSIGASAFFGCKALKSLSIPASVRKIGMQAFTSSGITSIELPSSLEALSIMAFAHTPLTSIELPSSLNTISMSAFAYCDQLTTVTLHDGLYSIDTQAFNGCKSLRSVEFPNTLSSIGMSAFRDCSQLDNVSLPNSLKELGQLAFSGCTGLTWVSTGNSLETIGTSIFSGCSRLYYVDLGASIRKIESSAFRDCTQLQTISCYAEFPPVVSEDAFPTGQLSLVSLRVPTVVGEDYKESEPWKDCQNIYAMFSNNGKCEKPVISLSNGKISAQSTTPGAQCNITYYVITNPDIEEDEDDLDTMLAAFETMMKNLIGMMMNGSSSVAEVFGMGNKSHGYGIGSASPTLMFKVEAYATADNYFTSEKAITTFELADVIGGGTTGDMDGNGELNVKDVTMLVNKILKK